MGRTSTLPKRLQPMLATLTDAPFDDPGWVFEDKYDGFRMVAKIEGGKVTLYSRNGKIISHSYIEVAKALEGVKGDAVIDGELVALDKNGVSHFQFLQNALRHEAKLLYALRPDVSAMGKIYAGSRCSNAKSGSRTSCRAISSSRSAVIARHPARSSSRKRSARALKASWPSGPTARICRAPARTTG